MRAIIPGGQRRTLLGVRLLVAIVLVLTGAHAAPASWVAAAGGTSLVRPVFWEGMPGATADGSTVTIDGASALVIDRYGPRLHISGDFQVVASLQPTTDDLAALALIDGVPQDKSDPASMRRVEFGLEHGSIVLGTFEAGSPQASVWRTFATDAPLGPVTLGLSREADAFVLRASGVELGRVPDPGIFESGQVLLGARVAAGNALTLSSLEAQVPTGQTSALSIDRCTPTRLLVAGADAQSGHTGLWWIWPDEGFIRQVDPGTSARSYLVAASPNGRWVAYYQTPDNYNPATDRFVVDTWVMNLASDERYKLVTGTGPFGWVEDSSAVILSDHPDRMVLVPTGEQVPTIGTPIYPLSMRSLVSPDGTLRATVAKTPQGAAGVAFTTASSGEDVLFIPTGRGAPQLAWSPDSSRLAFTSGTDGPGGLDWKLRVVDLASQRASVLDLTQDMQLHSVIWAPPLPCP